MFTCLGAAGLLLAGVLGPIGAGSAAGASVRPARALGAISRAAGASAHQPGLDKVPALPAIRQPAISLPEGITTSDEALWFTSSGDNAIGEITTGGDVST